MRMSMTEISHPDYHGPIFVLNKSTGKLRGTVVFNVTDQASSQAVPVGVADTFLAINLLDKVMKKQLTESLDFRQAISRGLLRLIDETEANEINSRAGARQEFARLQKRRDVDNIVQSASYGGASEASALQEGDAGESELSGIHPRLWGLAEKIHQNGEITIINQMRAVVGELSIKDFRYAKGVATSEGYGKLGKYANSQIRKKKGLPPLKRKKKIVQAA